MDSKAINNWALCQPWKKTVALPTNDSNDERVRSPLKIERIAICVYFRVYIFISQIQYIY